MGLHYGPEHPLPPAVKQRLMSKMHDRMHEADVEAYMGEDWARYRWMGRPRNAAERTFPAIGDGKHHSREQFRRAYIQAFRDNLDRGRPHMGPATRYLVLASVRRLALAEIKYEDIIQDVWQRRHEAMGERHRHDPRTPTWAFYRQIPHAAGDAAFARWTLGDFRAHCMRLYHRLPGIWHRREHEDPADLIHEAVRAHGLSPDQSELLKRFAERGMWLFANEGNPFDNRRVRQNPFEIDWRWSPNQVQEHHIMALGRKDAVRRPGLARGDRT